MKKEGGEGNAEHFLDEKVKKKGKYHLSAALHVLVVPDLRERKQARRSQ